MIDQNEAIIDRLKALKAKCGKSISQIAKECDVPESTVTRILSGKTPNPTVATVIAMYKAMGGTAADVFDDTVKVDVVSEAPQVVVPTIDERLYNEVIGIYKDLLKSKDIWIKILFGLVSILVFFVIAIVIIDLLHGGIGYVRY